MMTRERALAVILDCLPWDMIDVRRSYPRSLPYRVAPWYVYLHDGGHSVLAAVADAYGPGEPPENFLAVMPVRTVLNAEFTVSPEGFVIVAAEYDPDFGVVYSNDDREF